MYFVRKLWARKARKRDYARISELATLEFPFLIAVCLVYLCGVVTASDIKSASSLVPSRSSSPPTSSYSNFQSLSSSSRTSSSSATVLSKSDAAPSSSKINHHHRHHQYHSNPHHQPQLDSPSPPPTDAYSPSWYNTHMNDPRMGFFFSNSGSPSAPAAIAASPDLVASPYPQQKSAPLVPRPRSLSGFPTLSSSPPSTSGSGDKKKKRKKVKKSKQIAPESKSGVADSEPVPSTSTDLIWEPERSRTFLLTPLLAYLVPVFVAQMFGMGMIPAAALITLPIFLLPLGLTAAVFLI